MIKGTIAEQSEWASKQSLAPCARSIHNVTSEKIFQPQLTTKRTTTNTKYITKHTNTKQNKKTDHAENIA